MYMYIFLYICIYIYDIHICTRDSKGSEMAKHHHLVFDGMHQAKAKKKETAACKVQRLHGMHGMHGCIPGYGLRVDAPKFIFRSPE